MKKIVLILMVLTTVTVAFANTISESQQKWIAKYTKQDNCPEPGDMLINTDPEPGLKEGFVELYNKKNLDGWTIKQGQMKFEARGDSIVGSAIPKLSSGYLCTKKDDYTDFIFTCELKWEGDGNSGVMFRAQSKPGGKKNVKETVFGPQAEMEGYKKKRCWSGGIYGQSCGGWYYPMWLDAHKKVRGSLKEMGEWNRLTIKAQGKTIKIWFNGLPAAHWETEEYMKGFFGLQIHSGKGSIVHFRNIKVKEL